MSFVTLAPIAAAAALAGYMLGTARTGAGGPTWPVPAALSAGFLGFSVLAVWREGPLGFWALHSASLWGNQVWFDLLLAAGIGWTLILPRARAANMVLWPWALLVLSTGCIGFLAMLARLLWLERRPV